MKVCVKSGVKQLHLFKEEYFPFYEAYIACDDDLNKLLNTSMKLVSIHMPSAIKINDIKYTVDFNGMPEIVKESYNKLEEILSFSNKNGVEFVIIHLGFFNSYKENRYEVLDKITDRFNMLNTENVKICVENIPCWINISFENEPLLSNEKHLNYFKKRCPKIGLVYDIDHAAINAVFHQFYSKKKDNYLNSSDKIKFRKDLERVIIKHVNENTDNFDSIINEYIRQDFSKSNPDIIHALGSDYCNYKPYNNLPLIGEAIPLNFQGKIQGCDVIDRINHLIWLEQVTDKKEIVITLELVNREDDYNYIEQIKDNYDFFNDFFND